MVTGTSIIFEDHDLLVVNKPADLVCHPSKTGPMSSLVGRVRLHLGEASEMHLINRLDRETSGVVLIAKNLPSARQLRAIWEQRQVVKEYWAIVHGHPARDHEFIDAPLGKDETSAVAIKDTIRPDGLPSQTEYWVKARFWRDEKPFSLLRVRPRTGRKHQIRIHLSARGHPLVGDKIYGSDEKLYLNFVTGRLASDQQETLLLPNHALHCFGVRLEWKKIKYIFFAALETELWKWVPSTVFETFRVLSLPNKVHPFGANT